MIPRTQMDRCGEAPDPLRSGEGATQPAESMPSTEPEARNTDECSPGCAACAELNQQIASKKVVAGEQRFVDIGTHIGQLVQTKNAAYGDSFAKTDRFLELLYPHGIPVTQYGDALALVRIFDKMMRIATAKDALEENPFADIVGYGILGVANHQTLLGGNHDRT